MPRKKKIESIVVQKVLPELLPELLPESLPESLLESQIQLSSNSNDIDNTLSRDTLIPKHPCRENLYKKLFELLTKYNKDPYFYSQDDLQKFSLNLERGIFNYAVTNCTTRDWDYVFKHFYISKAVRIYTNLNSDSYIKNIDLINRLFKKEFTEFELAYFDSEEIFPSRYYELIERYRETKTYVKQEATNDGAHFCGRCKTYKTTYYQLQTRSAKIIGWKSTLLITSWLCYWENSCSPSLILKC